MKFNDVTYDRLKFVVLIALPALAALYLGLGQIWHFPKMNEVGASIGVIAVFLGTLLQISNAKFKAEPDGYFDITPPDDEDAVNPKVPIVFNKHPADLAEQKTVVLKVGKAPKSKKPPVEDVPEY